MNKTFFQDDEKVVINGKEFDLELFLTLEPNYQYNKGWKRNYVQSVRNSYGNGAFQMSGPLEWDAGNKYCTKVNDLIYLKQYLSSEMTT
tara:strand:+ start:411 stop:677 length:267 start_codon:yes stop_codon:yes gene_type:complete